MSEVSSLILFDTHIWWRWVSEPRKLSRSQARAIEQAERRDQWISVSAMSLWELAQMAARSRIAVREPVGPWLEEMAGHPIIRVLPLTPEIAATAAQLGGSIPPDPADRIIIATALCHKLKLLTADERIRAWGGIPVI